jgi:hypothetical protein
VLRNPSNPFVRTSLGALLGVWLAWHLVSFSDSGKCFGAPQDSNTIVLEFYRINSAKIGVRVTGFSSQQFETLRALESNAAEFSKSFQLHVVSNGSSKSDAQENTPAVLGTTSLVTDPPSLLFEPRFSLQDGIRYRARIQLNGVTVRAELFHAAETRHPTTVVEQVFPTGTRLPENLLKFYIHFSNPMAMRDAYAHVHLRDEHGRELIQPFLEINEELWDRQGKRLTLLLDPGRIKRGLVPNVENGSILHTGGRYELTIDATLQDSQGQPLVRSYRKEFTAIDSDHRQPHIDEWKLETPKVGSREPLRIRFGESLEHALVSRGIHLKFSGGIIDGQFSFEHHESEGCFIPADAWKAGEYELQVNSYVEDLAGNSLRKPFEIEITDGERRLQDGFLSRHFSLK